MANKKAYSKKNIINSLNNILKEQGKISSLLKNDEIKTYTYTYEKFIEHFKNLSNKDDKKGKEEWLVIGSSIVYSWMPTILNIAGRDPKADKNLHKIKEDAIEGLNNISKNLDGESSEKDLKKLKMFINNSVVGMSKFLHFSFPDEYPIWDSRVESVLYETAHPKWDPTKSNYHRIKIIGNYMEYRKSCLELIKDNKNGLIKKFDKYEELKGLRDLRKIEFLLFLKGGKK